MLSIKRILIIVACCVVSACGSLLDPVQSRPVLSYEIIDNLGLEQTACTNPNSNISLYILPMRANPPYATTKMYYETESYQLDRFNYSQWVTTPSDMLTQAMLTQITNSCMFHNVVTSHNLANANYSLVTILLNLRQKIDNHNSLASAHLTVMAELVNLETNQIVATKVFALTTTTQVGPGGLVSGVNQLTQTLNKQLLVWMKQILLIN